MSSASKVQAAILVGASALALSSEVCSLLVLNRGGKLFPIHANSDWAITPPHLAIGALVVWDGVLGIYAFYQYATSQPH